MTVDSFKLRRCSLPHVHAVEARSNRAFPRHTHDSYGIGLIVSGAQRSWSGRGSVEAGRGSLITCNPGEVHDGIPIGDGRAWKMLYFSPSLIASLLGDIVERSNTEFEFSQPVIRPRTDQARRFQSLYSVLTEATDGPAEEQALLLFAELLSFKRHRTALLPNIARAKARIDDDPSAPIDLGSLARLSNMTRFQLIRAFAKQTGFTPHAYIVQKRLDISRSMLSHKIRLADAAIASGFADQSHFTRAFARRYGMTPGVYADAFR